MKPIWKTIIIQFLTLRVITLASAWFGLKYLPFKWSFPYWDVILEPFGHPLFWSWANFDGVHYIMLARDGYQFGLTQAFFPAYMLLIRYFSYLIPNEMLVGLIISNGFFIGSLYMIYKLIKLDYSDKIAIRTMWLFTLFPTSFFFLSFYTESLFLFLLIAAFYFIRTKQYHWAALIGIPLTLTRIVGIFLVPAFLMEVFKDNKELKKGKQGKEFKLTLKFSKHSFLFTQYIKPHINYAITNFSKVALAFVPLLGLLSYMWYLWQYHNDPLLFAHVQSDFGAGRNTDKLVLLYQVIFRYIKMIFTVDRTNPLYFTVWLEFISTLSMLSLLVWAIVKKIRPSYVLFSFLALILPTLTGTFSSMPRYVLVAFPAFIVMGMIKKTWIRCLILTGFTMLLFICTAMFTRGYWIS